MKILATGDLHLDERSWLGPEWLAEQARVWRRICELAAEEEVDALIFAGDAFQHRRPTPAELIAFQAPLGALRAETAIDVLAIAGNHDVENAERPTGLELFESLIDVHRVPGVWPAKVPVCTLPWTPVSRLVAGRNGGDRDDLNDEAAALLVETARGLRAEVDGPAILALHWSISGAVSPSGADVGIFREPVLDVYDLEALGFDAIVAGHIHKAQTWRAPEARPQFYVGSPLPLNFGEGGDEHGVWILDFTCGSSTAASAPDLPRSGGRVTPESSNLSGDAGSTPASRFVPIKSRKFLTFELEPGEGQAGLLCPEMWDGQFEGAIIRARFTATRELARRIDNRKLRQALLDAGAWRVVIQPEIVREEIARVAGLDESLGELEALGLYLDAQGIERLGKRGAAMAARTKAYLEEVAT